MTSCQVSSLLNSLLTATVTVGVFGLAALGLMLVIKIVTERGGGLETKPTG